ncbi:hypothetical protein [Spirosoma radiotolerans]|uniref:hypothetical protein n=1 Tax=Spirosoma radiotolerans TaxID=1379870 RepID=UPI000A4329D8|nr:hypothetical protein [Spirosoma radiotolerans]
MHASEQFGGPDTGCPALKQAVEKFATFKPASSLLPTGGLRQMEPRLATCK